MHVSPEQIRAARALLRLGQGDLARRAGVSVVTIRRAEAGTPGVSRDTVDAVRRALEMAGVVFLERGVQRREAGRPDKQGRYDAMMEIARRSAERQRRLPRLDETDLYDEDGLPA